MTREALSRSLDLARVHPWILLSLGCALVFALAAMFTGVGLVLFPWFACELFALSLAASGIEVRPRGLTWLKAAAIILTASVLFSSVVALAGLVFGPDIASADRAQVLPPLEAALRVFGIIAISLIALFFALPFLHVPMILLERDGPLGTAVLESVLLVRRAGIASSFRLVLTAALFALLPAMLSAIVTARMIDRASTPMGVVLSLPLLLFSVPLGLSLLSQGYLLDRHHLPVRHLVRPRALPRTVTALLSASVLVPVASLALLLFACVQDAPLIHAALPEDAVLLASRTSDFTIPTSTLRVSITPRAALVQPLADDVARTLAVPRADARTIDEVRAYDLDGLYWVELRSEHTPLGHAMFNAAGARLDDTVHRALDERLGVPRALVFAPMFILVTWLLLAALTPLAEARRGDVQALAQQQAIVRATRIAWALVPCWTTIAVLGILAFFGV
jgi:hypothetical protein